VKKNIKTILNKVLRSKGVAITRIHDVDFLSQKYAALITEMEGVFSELLFKKLPQNPKRALLLSKLNGTQISEGFYLLHYLHESLQLEGDICEFGTANGTTSALIASEIVKTNKNLWLFDSFQGLSKPTKEDKLIDDIFHLGSMGKYEGTMSYTKEEVLERLQTTHFPKRRIKIIPGFIEETIIQMTLPKQVSFAYIDFDLYSPIRTALEFLHSTLAKGGYIVVDDYGAFSEGAKVAVDEFVSYHKRKYKITFPLSFAGHFCILKKIS